MGGKGGGIFLGAPFCSTQFPAEGSSIRRGTNKYFSGKDSFLKYRRRRTSQKAKTQTAPHSSPPSFLLCRHPCPTPFPEHHKSSRVCGFGGKYHQSSRTRLGGSAIVDKVRARIRTSIDIAERRTSTGDFSSSSSAGDLFARLADGRTGRQVYDRGGIR